MASVRPELLFMQGPQKGHHAVLMSNVVVAGRHPQAEIPIVEECVSRQQMQFTLTHDGWIVENLSKNTPMRINGKKYKPGKKILLGTGDVLQVGVLTEILFVEAEDDPAAAVDAYHQKNTPVQPQSVPVPVPVPVPVSSPASLTADSGPLTARIPEEVTLDEPEDEEEEELTEDQLAAKAQRAKIRKYIIGGGIYLVVMVVGVILLMMIKGRSGSEKNGQPPLLRGEEIRKALTAELGKPANEVSSQRALSEARAMYTDRGKVMRNRYLCLKYYRLYLAYRPENRRVFEPEDRRQFEEVQNELVSKIQQVYDDGWAYENGRQWSDAYDEYEKILLYIPMDETIDDPVVRSLIQQNVKDHLEYVSKFLTRKKSRR